MHAVAEAELTRVDAAHQVPGGVAQALEHAQRLLAGHVGGTRDVLEHEDRGRLHQGQPLQHRGERPALLDALGHGALEAVEASTEQAVPLEVRRQVEGADRHGGRELDDPLQTRPRPQGRLGEVGGGHQPVEVAVIADDRHVGRPRLAPAGEQRRPVEALSVGQHVHQDAFETPAVVGMQHELPVRQAFDPVAQRREGLARALRLGGVAWREGRGVQPGVGREEPGARGGADARRRRIGAIDRARLAEPIQTQRIARDQGLGDGLLRFLAPASPRQAQTPHQRLVPGERLGVVARALAASAGRSLVALTPRRRLDVVLGVRRQALARPTPRVVELLGVQEVADVGARGRGRRADDLRQLVGLDHRHDLGLAGRLGLERGLDLGPRPRAVVPFGPGGGLTLGARGGLPVAVAAAGLGVRFRSRPLGGAPTRRRRQVRRLGRRGLGQPRLPAALAEHEAGVTLERLTEREAARQLAVHLADLGLRHWQARLDELVEQAADDLGAGEVGSPGSQHGRDREAAVLLGPDVELVVDGELVGLEERPEAEDAPAVHPQRELDVLLRVEGENVAALRKDAEQVEREGQGPGPQADPGEGVAICFGHQHPRFDGVGAGRVASIRVGVRVPHTVPRRRRTSTFVEAYHNSATRVCMDDVRHASPAATGSNRRATGGDKSTASPSGTSFMARRREPQAAARRGRAGAWAGRDPVVVG